MPSLEDLSPTLSILKPTTQSILVQLCAHQVNNEVTVSHADLAAWSGIKSRNTIRSAIRELVDRDLLKIIKPGQEGSTSIFRLLVPGKDAPDPRPAAAPTISLNPENQVLLAAIKKSLSPAIWQSIKRDAAVTRETEDSVIIRRYFGPGRLNG
ncbi:MAG: helix-turn-helix domain-containing protein [Candidatus Manganitrophaceae bacterium]